MCFFVQTLPPRINAPTRIGSVFSLVTYNGIGLMLPLWMGTRKRTQAIIGREASARLTDNGIKAVLSDILIFSLSSICRSLVWSLPREKQESIRETTNRHVSRS